MKIERVQFDLSKLKGWVTEAAPRSMKEEDPEAIWTAFELGDHLEACELVVELGVLADRYCCCPEIDVRRNIVFVRATTEGVGITQEDFDFALAVDRELGTGLRAKSLVHKEIDR